MAKVVPGRYTADIEGDFVVLLIGMRFNKLWKIHKWWPVFTAMPKMVKFLKDNPQEGLLGVRQAISGRVPILIQYWRSYEHLERFSRSADAPHLEPWRKYVKAIGSSGDVGVWHETYKVSAGNYECIYANMPAFGLAGAGTHVPVGKKGNASAYRIGARAADDVYVETPD